MYMHEHYQLKAGTRDAPNHPSARVLSRLLRPRLGGPPRLTAPEMRNRRAALRHAAPVWTEMPAYRR